MCTRNTGKKSMPLSQYSHKSKNGVYLPPAPLFWGLFLFLFPPHSFPYTPSFFPSVAPGLIGQVPQDSGEQGYARLHPAVDSVLEAGTHTCFLKREEGRWAEWIWAAAFDAGYGPLSGLLLSLHSLPRCVSWPGPWLPALTPSSSTLASLPHLLPPLTSPLPFDIRLWDKFVR